MTAKRVASLIILSTILVLGLFTLWQGFSDFPAPTLESVKSGEYTDILEKHIRQNFPLRENFKEMAIQLKLWAGESRQGDVFIGEQMLIKNLPLPNNAAVKANMREMLAFADQSTVPTYAMLIPTKCAIKQQELPEHAQLFNQKSFIESVYTSFSGRISSVDIYPVLFSNSEEDIYYKTDPNLTALGSFYVYSVLANRLNVGAKPANAFSVQHLVHNFYGATYQESPYKNIAPDVVSVYRFEERRRDMTVTHNKEAYPYSYFTLFPAHLAALQNPLDVNLGGNTGDVQIRVRSSPYQRKLLVIGDEAMLPIVPFLTVHYEEVRFVDFSKMTPQQILALDINYYDQVLFAYSLETFTQTDTPSLIRYS